MTASALALVLLVLGMPLWAGFVALVFHATWWQALVCVAAGALMGLFLGWVQDRVDTVLEGVKLGGAAWKDVAMVAALILVPLMFICVGGALATFVPLTMLQWMQ